jgi:uncharacterized Fe-S center protein
MPLHGAMRRRLVQRPVVDAATCALCGECWKYCPAKAIQLKGRRIDFDYEKCIRCYCCIEVCPQGALKAVYTLPCQLLRRMTKRLKG